MPEEVQDIPEGIEVSHPVIQPGTVQVLNRAAFSNPAPLKLQRIVKALNYFVAGLVTTVGATDLFTGKQSKIICFILGVFILGLGAIELAFGVRPEEKEIKV